MDAIALFLLAFSLEMLDNGLGGGFGTILSPLLLLFGYDPRVIVPAILMSEMVSGLWGGSWHLRFGNVSFRGVLMTLVGSLAAMALATYLIGVVFPASITKVFISALAVAMGVIVIAQRWIKSAPRENPRFGWMPLLGAVIGFNKGGSGGGYGPLSVCGYIVLGMPVAIAIGTTTVAEGIACALGVVLYSQFTGIVSSVTLPIAAGAFIADPVSAWVNNKFRVRMRTTRHRSLVGATMTILGGITFLKALGF